MFTNLKKNNSSFGTKNILVVGFTQNIPRGCFEVREGCAWFQDTKGFYVNWTRAVGSCCKNAIA